MKLCIPCMKCFLEDGHPPDKLMIVEVRDDGRYDVMCFKGHRSIVALQQQDFEVLFDLGANAILDGYYREAVSSFSAVLERFCEFYIRVICLKDGLDHDQIDTSWNHVSAQSERQVGAFIFLYTVENKNAPTLLTNKERGFRNDVIHKGKIPMREEAVRYGSRILELIRPILKDLKVNYADAVGKTVIRHLQNVYSKLPPEEQKSTLCSSTILSLSRADSEKEETMEEALFRMHDFRQRLGSM